MRAGKLSGIGVALLFLGIVLAALSWFSLAIISAKIILIVNLSGAMLLIFAAGEGSAGARLAEGKGAGLEKGRVAGDAGNGREWPAFLVLSFFLLFLFWVSSGHLFGYDMGIYRFLFNGYARSLPSLDYSGLPGWAVVGHDPGQHILGAVLTLYGFSVDWLLQYLYPFAAWLVGFGVYLVARRVGNGSIGLLALCFYAVSMSTLAAFQLFYFKTMFGLFLLLLLLLVVKATGLGPASVVLLAGIGAYHKPELVLAVPVIIGFSMVRRSWVPAALNLALSGILVLGLYFSHVWAYFRMGAGAFGGAGTFFSQPAYAWFSVLYMPFFILGFYFLAVNRRYLLAGLMAFVLVIVAGQVLFYNRFIIALDMFASIAAGGGAFWLLERKKFLGFVLVALTLGLTAYVTFTNVSGVSPLLDEGQVRDIAWMSGNTEEGSFVVSTNFDAPWVLGWSNRKVLAPGMFGWSDWDEERWDGFLAGNSSVRMLDAYGEPVYAYFSRTRYNDWVDMAKFSGPCFSKVLDNGRSLIVRYEPDSC